MAFHFFLFPRETNLSIVLYYERRPSTVAGFAKLAKGAGLKILSRRSSRVRIPYPALSK